MYDLSMNFLKKFLSCLKRFHGLRNTSYNLRTCTHLLETLYWKMRKTSIYTLTGSIDQGECFEFMCVQQLGDLLQSVDGRHHHHVLHHDVLNKDPVGAVNNTHMLSTLSLYLSLYTGIHQGFMLYCLSTV